ncbi:bifunctional apoptosis regulator [Nematostella vectensis]|uniref:bifunctional apoptosis regulator n=1 Tax=Nematostella vectensis TaxID=45351 RepID=UPI0013905BD5|nr:bifunctional apoptosis regulator [Nematostella vectensis]XP_048575356.1 bifunctional apoptosis regulator [Nematostella vectensis]
MEEGDDSRNSIAADESDFHCSCCYDLMVDPTTLNCGHNFCRFCLAHWWYSSRKTTCPECRQPWQGFPNVNYLLRKTIRKLFPEEIKERETAIESNTNYEKVLKKFEKFGNRRLEQGASGGFQRDQNYHWAVFTIKCVAIAAGCVGILMFVYDTLAMILTSTEPLVSKPVTSWTPEDVSKWVAGLGPWTKGYGQKFLDSGINGMVLVSLTETDLEDPPLEMKVAIHRRALIQALEGVKNLGVKPPSDLWEYKAAYPARCIFLLWGFREFPRATAIYTFFFLHDEIFMPLLYHTSERDMDYVIQELGERWHVPSVEYIRFFTRVLLTPYYLVGKFAYKWIHVNLWTVGLIVTFCFMMTASELLKTRWLFMGGWRNIPSIFLQNLKPMLGNGLIHLIIWHFMPQFVGNFFFYWLLLMSPVYGWSVLKTSWYEADRQYGPGTGLLARQVVSWVWRKVSTRLGV